MHLVSASSWTYETVGSSDVAIVGAEDKRQITACVAASLRGDLLPLQLIFQGKTTRSLPLATAASTAARVDITHSANHWSTQIQSGAVTGIAELLKMAAIKPLVLQWCVDSWNSLRERKQLILDGWERSCLCMFDITSEHRRNDAVELIALKQLEMDVLPDGAEPDGYPDVDDDNEDDELDVSKPRAFGKQSTRIRCQAKTFGFQIDPTRIEIDQEPATAAAAASR